jgi:hypothetical protein
MRWARVGAVILVGLAIGLPSAGLIGAPRAAVAPGANASVHALSTAPQPVTLRSASPANAGSASGGDPGTPLLWLGGPRSRVVPAPSAPGTAVGPQSVNPYAFYSSEPAPMGLGDFGIGSSGASYSYATSAFEGSARIDTYSAVGNGGTNFTTFQLNVVVVMSKGSALAEYWIQDVPIYNTSSDYIYFENNVWNFSGSDPPRLPANSVTGNGSVYTTGSEQYYADVAGSAYSGSGTRLSLPANLSTEVVASNLSGSTHVGFRFDDGYGWETFDNVTFPWTKGWTFHGFEVTGGSYNPFGLFDDAEWIVGGPGNSASTEILHSNLNLSLEEFNGHNFEGVPAAYDFGSDTAESASNAKAALPVGSPPGPPADRLLAGSGSLQALWGQTNLSIVNVSAPIRNGTLVVDGLAVPYRGAIANLTLFPGSYHFAIRDGSGIIATKNATVTAGEYLPLSFAELTIGPNRTAAQQNVTATGSGFAAGSTVSVDWPNNATPICNTTAGSNGSFSCRFTVPLDPAGSYNLTASDDTSAADVAYSILTVTTNLTVGASSDAPAVDFGIPLTFWANASGGFRPYLSYAWDFGDGTFDNTASNMINYTYTKTGPFTLVVTVRDRIGDAISAQAPVTIRPDPKVTAPSANRTSADVGQSATFSVLGSNGAGPYQYAWTGLPAGCVASGASVSCVNLTTSGNSTIDVTVTDSEGVHTTGPALAFRVYPDPRIESLSNLRPFADVGQSLALLANVVDGSGGFVFTWSGLPTGCASSSAEVDCRVNASGPLTVSVVAQDSDGVSARSYDLPIEVARDPSVVLSASHAPGADLGEPLGLTATVQGGSGAFTYGWSGLPEACLSQNLSQLPCAARSVGPVTVTVSVVDQSGARASATLPITVYSDPEIAWVGTPANVSDVGHPIVLSVGASNGEGPYEYAWTGLPSGCFPPDGTEIRCTPTAAGPFSLGVEVIDVNGGAANTTTVGIVVHPSPSMGTPAVSAARVVAGYPLSLTALPTAGTGPYSYAWYQLPGGCDPRNVSEISCRPTQSGQFEVTVLATDALGESVNATVEVTVIAAVLGLSPDDGYAVIALGLGALGVTVALVVRWVRRSGRAQREPTSEAAPPEP